MAFTLNRRLAQLVDSNGQLNTGKIPNDYISSDHIADNVITASMLHTSFTVSTSNLTAIDTDDVSEGSSNLYYTDARVDARLLGNNIVSNHTIIADNDGNSVALTTDGSIEITRTAGGPYIDFKDSAAEDYDQRLQVISGNFNFTGDGLSINGSEFIDSSRNIDIGSGTVSSGAVTMTNGSLTLTDGYNIQWGGAFGSGNPAISAASNFIVFYPTGNTDGEVIRIDADGIDMNGHNLTEVGNISATGTATVGGTTLANAFEFQVNGDAKITNYIEAAQANFGNTTLTGFLRGPSTFTIDPATHGDDTGTVVIAGNLQVDGTTTTINSSTLTVDDIRITLARNAANAAAADGGGIELDGANASILYDSTNDEWHFNRSLKINGPTGGSNPQIEFLNTNGVIRGGKNIAGTGTDTLQLFNNGLGVAVEYGGNVGIGTDNPDYRLHMERGDGSDNIFAIQNTSAARLSEIAFVDENDVKQVRYYYDNGGNRSYQHVNGNGLTVYSSQSSAEIARFGLASNGYTASYFNGNVGIGTDSPYKKLEVVGDIQLDATDANIWLKSGATGTNGFINWTFNTDSTVYNKIGMDYDTRASTGFHIDAGYPITIDASASAGKAINFDISGVTKALIDGTGNLGINTTAPQSKLETNLHSGSDSSLMNANTVNDVHLIRAGYGQNAATVSNAGAKWGLRFVGRNDGTYDNGKSGAIFAVSEDSAGYNRQVGLAFHTSPFDAAHTERMRITSTGKVGIGETSPDTPLEVKSSGTGEDTGIRLTDTNGTIRGNLYFGGAQNFVIHGASAPVGTDAPALQFATGGPTPDVRMTILEEGKVGIGTDNPAAMLDVEAGDLGGTTGNTTTAAIFRAGRQNLILQDTRTATGTDWNNATFKIIAQIDSTNHQSIDFVNDGNFSEHIDIRTGNQVFNTRFSSSGKVGIKNDNPSYLLDVGSSSSTQSNIFRGTVNGDFIFTLAKNATNLFSIRNNSTSIVHLNTQNNATLALGVSSTNNTGTIEQQVRIYSNGTMSMTASSAGNGSSIWSTGAYGSGQGDNKTHFGYNASGSYNNYIRGSTTIFSSAASFDSTVTVNNNNNDYNFKAKAGSSNSWFGVYDDTNDSANIIVTRSNSVESFKHLGHTGETVIKATGTGLRIESTDNEAIQISGNGGGINFQTGTNQRIYFNSYRALEGNNTGSNLQVGEGYSVIALQANTVVHGNLTPNSNNAYDLGSSTHVWRDLYIGDLILSNETRKNDDGSTGNSVDGTTGNWTIQEGEEHLYIINNKSGKKYKFALEEIE